MNKVYVVCEPVHIVNGVPRTMLDLTPAAKFGEMEILVPYAQSMIASVPMMRSMKEKLRNFTVDDYLLPVGDPVLMCAAAMLAGESTGGKVKFLKWDKKIKDYIVVNIDTSGRAL